MSGVLNLPIDAGTTRRLSLTITVDGSPLDLTGATATFITEKLAKDLTRDGSVLSLELTPQETGRMFGGGYVIDVQWPSGDVVRLLAGQLLVDRPPQRPVTP